MSTNNHQQDRIITIARVLRYIFASAILALLSHEILSLSTRAENINQVFQSSVIIKTLLSIGVYFFLFCKHKHSFQWTKSPHVILVTLNILLGIIAFVYAVLDFALVILDPFCYEFPDRFNRILVLLCVTVLLVFFPIYIKLQPNQDIKSIFTMTISAGSMSLISCIFISSRIIMHQIIESVSNNRNSTFLCIEKDIYNLSSIKNGQKTLQIPCLMFAFICGIFIYNQLKKNEKPINHEQQCNEISDSASSFSLTSDNTNLANCGMKNNLSFIKSSFGGLIIGILIFITLIIFTFLCSPTFSINNQLNHFKLNLSLKIAKILIYTMMIGCCVSYWSVISQWKIDNSNQSPIDKFILPAGTFGQVIISLVEIACASYSFHDDGNGNYVFILWICSNIFRIVQVILQQYIVEAICKRAIEDYVNEINEYGLFCKRKFNPCLILCLSNFGFTLNNFMKQEAVVDVLLVQQNFAFEIVQHLTLPLEILNRIHAATFLLNVIVTMNQRHVPSTFDTDYQRLIIT